jgi:hypothetical protein
MTPKQKAEIFAVSENVVGTLAKFANVIVQEKFGNQGFDGSFTLKLQFWLFERSHDFVVDNEDPCVEFEFEGTICFVGRNANKEIRKHFFEIVAHSAIHDALCMEILQRGGGAKIIAYEGLGTADFNLALFPHITPAKAA